MDAIEAIKTRTSIRRYADKPISKELLIELIDCGRMAPTGCNQQPWKFVVITDKDILQKLSLTCTHGRFIKDAGACIAVFCKKGAITMIEDACAATENIIIAANAYGIGTCWVNSHRKEHSEDVKEILKCPDDHELMTILAAGYPKEDKKTPKRPIEEMLCWDSFY